MSKKLITKYLFTPGSAGSGTVKFTSKSYHFLKEDSQSSDDENKIMRDPKNGKLEFGNIFMN